MIYRWEKFKQRLRLAWMIIRGKDALIVCRDDKGVIRYHYYPDGDDTFFALANELSKHGIEWYTDWLKENAIEK